MAEPPAGDEDRRTEGCAAPNPAVKATPGGDDNTGMDGLQPSEAIVWRGALDRLLADTPGALVAAIGEDGIFVPLPASLGLGEWTVLPGRSAMDFVRPGDWERIIAAWDQAHAAGSARTVVRLEGAANQEVDLYYFDERREHGVFVGVVVGPGAQEALAHGVELDDAPPRLARVRKNELAEFVAVDDATQQILGWSAEEMIGRRSLELIHPDDEELAIRSWMVMLAARESPRVRLRHQRRDGTWVWLEVTNHNHLDDPDGGFVAADMIDVSDEVATHEALRRREQLFARLAEALPSGLLQVDRERQVVYTNTRLEQILGVPRGTTADEQFASVVRDDWPRLDVAITAAVTDGLDIDLEVQVQGPDQRSLRRCLARIRALTDDATATGAIVSIEDVTESAQLRAELERRATIDMLTRCLNRATVMSALEATLAQGGDEYTAVIFADLDDFKSVNDRYGHAVGDELLITAGERLTRAVRDGDFVGRLGGDEFLIVCPDVSGPSEASGIAERVQDALHGEFQLAGSRLVLRASVGVACAPRRAATAEALVSEADAAMYAAKRGERPPSPQARRGERAPQRRDGD